MPLFYFSLPTSNSLRGGDTLGMMVCRIHTSLPAGGRLTAGEKPL